MILEKCTFTELGVLFVNMKVIRQNIENIENTLKHNGFNISRKIGEFKKLPLLGCIFTSYILYLDDTNKKWLMASPFLPDVGKIRSYSDLVAYDFFDEDGRDFSGKVFRGILTGAGAIGLGMAGGLVGGVVGAKAGSALAKIFPQAAGATSAYGLAIAIKHSDENNSILTFDFMDAFTQHINMASNIITKWVVNSTHKETGMKRSESRYKSDVHAIKEMAQVFELIMQSNI